MRTSILALAAAALLGLFAGRPAPAAAQQPAPMRGMAQPRKVLDVAAMERIAFAEKPGPWQGPRPAKEVEANVYTEPFWRYAEEPLPVPPGRETAPSPEQTLAFDYVHASDVAFDGPGQNGWVPADCHLAVGWAHVIAVINSEFWIYDKAGRMLYHTTFDSLMGLPAGYAGAFDPKVRFDPGRNRFYMVVLDRHPTQALAMYKLAISIGSDPTQGWYVYWIDNQLNGRGIDYEELGFGPEALYLTGNYYLFGGWPAPTMGFRGSAWVLDLDALVAGNAVSFWRFDDMRGSNNEIVGVLKTPASPAASAPGLDAITIALGSGPNSTTRRALFYGWTIPGGFPAAAPSFARQFVDVAESQAVPNARQQGGPAQVITNNLGSVFLGASIRDGFIATALPVEGNGRCNTRTYMFDVRSWPAVSVAHTLDFPGTGAGIDFYWPNSARNAYGEQGVVYSQSSPTQFVSSFWTMRQADQVNYPQFGPVATGVAYYGSGSDTPLNAYRWGDYSGIDVDPIGQGFWYFDSFANFGAVFGTRIVHVPHAEFVDAAFQVGFGTRTNPWPQAMGGFDNARDGNDVVFRTGSYTVPAGTTITKRLKVIADGGSVTIGAP